MKYIYIYFFPAKREPSVWVMNGRRLMKFMVHRRLMAKKNSTVCLTFCQQPGLAPSLYTPFAPSPREPQIPPRPPQFPDQVQLARCLLPSLPKPQTSSSLNGFKFGGTRYNCMLVAASFTAFFVSPFALVFHFTIYFIDFESGRTLVEAMTRSGLNILNTFVLGVLAIYVCAVITFVAFK